MVFGKLLSTLEKHTLMVSRRLGENIRLDFPSIDSPHRLSATHGNNVASPLERSFRRRAEGIADGTPEELLYALYDASFRLGGDGKHPHFRLRDNVVNRCDRGGRNPYRKRFTRYLSYPAFHRAFIDPEGYLGTSPPDQLKRDVDGFLEAVHTVSPDQLEKGWLGIRHEVAVQPENIKRYPTPIWITPANEAPHRQRSVKGLDGDAKAREVVRQMALPGYAEAADRLMRIGLVAVTFNLEGTIDLYKPTVLDAVDSAFFFPGPTGERCGRTYCLEASLAEPRCAMEGRGREEYICMPFPVPVRVGTGKASVRVESVGCFEY